MQSNEPIEISAEELVSLCAEDLDKVESRLAGRKLVVEGIVNSSGENRKGRLFATLQAPALGMTCYFQESEYSRVMALSPGESIVADGILNSSPMIVILNECILR